MVRLKWIVGAVLAALPQVANAQLPDSDRALIAYDQKSIALTHVQLVDGTGAPPKADMTVLIRDGRISAVGPSRSIRPPADATVLNGSGKTLLPGFVMMHEHLHYPSLSRGFVSYANEFSRIYLAAGETTIRTGATNFPFHDIKVKREIDEGRQVGPDMDATAPFLNAAAKLRPIGPVVTSPEEARRTVDYWAQQGFTSFKAYTSITRDQLAASIDEAHRQGFKLTGHLCSVTYREAIERGIDNFEHGFWMMSDFVTDKKPDECPAGVGSNVAALDPQGPEVGEIIDLMVKRKVALTSTQAIFEAMSFDRSPDGAYEESLTLLSPKLRQALDARLARRSPADPQRRRNLMKLIEMELRFFRAGGLLMTGTDPTGYGDVLPGYTSIRQLQLMVEGGFTFSQAVQAQTLNGARYLGRDKDIGSVAAGKRADLVLVNGDPVANVKAMDNIETVFKAGVGYSRRAIMDTFRGRINIE